MKIYRLRPGVVTSRDCCIQGLLHPGVVTSRGCYIQGLLHSGVVTSRRCYVQGSLHPGVVTSRGLLRGVVNRWSLFKRDDLRKGVFVIFLWDFFL